MSKKTVVLLSGGIDSAVALALAKKQQHECYCLSFDYGQRHHFELRAARKLAVAMEVKDHKIIHLNLPNFATSALTNTELPVRTINNADERSRTSDLLITNQLLYQLSYVSVGRNKEGEV